MLGPLGNKEEGMEYLSNEEEGEMKEYLNSRNK
jgi:hypothetical protein